MSTNYLITTKAYKNRKVKGIMNGINENAFGTFDLALLEPFEYGAKFEKGVTGYRLPNVSLDGMKKMFCDLFMKEIEVVIREETWDFDVEAIFLNGQKYWDGQTKQMINVE